MDSSKFRFFDIAANLADTQFTGEYHGKKYHESDVHLVMQRASNIGTNPLIHY